MPTGPVVACFPALGSASELEQHFPGPLVSLGVAERFGVLLERIGLVDLDGELAAD
jgi:hypothetical protein